MSRKAAKGTGEAAEETRSLEPRFSSKLLGKKEDIPHFSL